MIEIIDERSTRTNILTPGGWVLDVGARGYVFAREMAGRGMNVVAVDPEPLQDKTLMNLKYGTVWISFVTAALVGIGRGGKQEPFASWDNGEPDCLLRLGGPVPARASLRNVDTLDVLQVMERFGVKQWDCVKMNCEGAEFEILKSWPGTIDAPIAKQITVSFHDHTGANSGGEATYDVLIPYLESIGYAVARHEREDRYSAGFSYWDSLFVLREQA